MGKSYRLPKPKHLLFNKQLPLLLRRSQRSWTGNVVYYSMAVLLCDTPLQLVRIVEAVVFAIVTIIVFVKFMTFLVMTVWNNITIALTAVKSIFLWAWPRTPAHAGQNLFFFFFCSHTACKCSNVYDELTPPLSRITCTRLNPRYDQSTCKEWVRSSALAVAQALFNESCRKDSLGLGQ